MSGVALLLLLHWRGGGSLVQVLEAGTIEDDGAAYLQVDFANAFLGGGVLGSGCVQVTPPNPNFVYEDICRSSPVWIGRSSQAWQCHWEVL